MIRAVLDANVFVSAVLSPTGIPGKIVSVWRHGEQIELVLSEAILKEIDRVLRYPRIVKRHRWPEAQVRAFIEDLARLAILTPGSRTPAVIAQDPPDNRYIECAVEGEADYIVSGDQHLLALGAYQSIRILSPRAFLEVLRAQRRAQPG